MSKELNVLEAVCVRVAARSYFELHKDHHNVQRMNQLLRIDERYYSGIVAIAEQAIAETGAKLKRQQIQTVIRRTDALFKDPWARQQMELGD